MVVVGASGTVYVHHNNGEPSTPWTPLPGPGPFSSGVAAVVFQGALFLFAVGGDSKNQIFFNVMNASGAWGGWSLLDGNSPSTPSAVVFNNVLHLFVHGLNDRVYMKTLSGAWSDWREVPGGGLTPSSPGAAVVNGQLVLMVRGVDNSVYTNTDAGGGFSTWAPVPGGALISDGPAVTAQQQGSRLRVVVRGLGDSIWINARDHAGHMAGWSPVTGLTSAAPAVVEHQGSVVVLVRGTDSRLYRGSISGDTLAGTFTPFAPLAFPEPVGHAPALAIM